jgi:hypothetical protein
MEISAALSAELSSLTEALDAPGIDLQQLLTGLVLECSHAVSSMQGLTVVHIIDGYPAMFTIFLNTAATSNQAARAARSSLWLPLDAISAAEFGSGIAFYAARAGAFVDFGADLAFSLGLPLEAVIRDEHLIPPLRDSTLSDLSRVNQAIGILLDQGFPPAEARVELRRRAEAEGEELAVAATRIIDATVRPL